MEDKDGTTNKTSADNSNLTTPKTPLGDAPKTDNTVLPLSVPTNKTTPNQTDETDIIHKQLEEARRSMEGPERTFERKLKEREDEIENKKRELITKLEIIGKQKESLEINWVALDNKRTDINKILDPILEEEDRIELEEAKLEGEERTSPLPEERQQIEKKRWEIQDKRKEIEKQKWELEEKLQKINSAIKENTDTYQGLLDEEEELETSLETLDHELISLVAETEKRVREREEAELRQQQEAEEKRRELAAKQQAEAEKAKHIAELSKKEEAEKKKREEEEIKAEKEEKERLAKIMAEQKKRAEMEIKRQEEARKNLEARRQEETEKISRRGQEEIARQKSVAEKKAPTTPENIIPSAPPVKNHPLIKTELTNPSQNLNDEDQNLPPIPSGQSSSLPALRTFKSDTEKITRAEPLDPAELNRLKKRYPWLK